MANIADSRREPCRGRRSAIRRRRSTVNAACRGMASEMPSCGLLVPGAMPGQAIAINQPVLTKDLHFLDDALKAELFGCVPARVPAGKPQIAPDETRVLAKLDVDTLKEPAAREGNRRPR